MIRLCAFDLDGTLLDSRGTLSERTAAALRDLSRNGTTLALISGRPPRYTEGFFLQIGTAGFTAASNGAYIASPDGNIIRNSSFPPLLAAQVSSLLEEHGARFAIQTRGGITGNMPVSSSLIRRFENYCAMAGTYGISCRLPSTDPDIGGRQTEGVLKIAVTGGSLPLAEYLSMIRYKFPSLSVSFSGDTVLDINLAGNSKGEALKEIAQLLGTKKEEICSFGDYDNDVPMFRASGLPVVMGNASDAVKAEARHVTASNDEDGVAQAVYRLILSDNSEV